MEKIISLLSEMTDQEKAIVAMVGLETIYKGIGLNALGHTSIDGHCYYIPENDNSLINTILKMLNSSDDARLLLREEVVHGCFRSFADKMFKGVIPCPHQS